MPKLGLGEANHTIGPVVAAAGPVVAAAGPVVAAATQPWN